MHDVIHCMHDGYFLGLFNILLPASEITGSYFIDYG